MRKNNLTKKSVSRQFDSRCEENYYKSITNDQNRFCPENLIAKYLDMEDKNERLQKLKMNFSAQGSRKLNSIHDSVVYQNDKYQRFLAPDYNLIKNGEYAQGSSINLRERNPKLMNNFLKFQKNRDNLWQSGITT